MGKSCSLDETAANLQKKELEFWEGLNKSGVDVDLKLARDLPDDTPDYILKIMEDFEEEASRFCFSGARGRVLDAGCGNGNLLLRALRREKGDPVAGQPALQIVGMDFSGNMLGRAALRAAGPNGIQGPGAISSFSVS